MQLSKADVDEKVDNAGAELLTLSGGDTARVTPELLYEVAGRHDLPVGVEVTNDPVARTIFVAAFCGEARDVLKSGKEAVWGKFEQLARLEKAA